MVFSLSLWIMCIVPSALAAPPGGHLNITEVLVDDLTNPTQLMISGTDLLFGPGPLVVTLGGFGPLTIGGTPTNTLIEALLPTNIPPGDYRLTISRGKKKHQNNDDDDDRGKSQYDEYDLTIGAVGLEGPTGPQGIQGIQGRQGEQGIQGRQGEQGEKGDPGPPPADISARVFNSADIVVPSTCPGPDCGTQALTFNSVIWDTSNIFNPSFPTRLTAPTTGKYYIWADVQWDRTDGELYFGRRGLYLMVNGTNAVADQAMPPGQERQLAQSISTHYKLNAGDYVELLVRHTTGIDVLIIISTAAGTSPLFGMFRTH